MVASEGFVILPEEQTRLESGEIVDFMPFREAFD
jgi:molybdopterin biosynthesis enzyme